MPYLFSAIALAAILAFLGWAEAEQFPNEYALAGGAYWAQHVQHQPKPLNSKQHF